MFQKTKSTFWVYVAYAWNSDDSAATINYGGPVPVDDGGTWTIPSNDECDQCHRGRQDRILGFEQVSLGLPGAQGLTLAQLVSQGLVTPAPSSISLTLGDDGTGLDGLALGWIHVNCGVTCHNSNRRRTATARAGMLLRLPAASSSTAPHRALRRGTSSRRPSTSPASPGASRGSHASSRATLAAASSTS